MIVGTVTVDQLAEVLAQHLAQPPVSPWGTSLQHLALWSPGLLILIGLFFLLRKPPTFIAAFIAAQQSQAVAMSSLATAVETMATRTDALEQVRMQKLDEVLVGQQLILGKIEAMERRGDHGSH